MSYTNNMCFNEMRPPEMMTKIILILILMKKKNKSQIQKYVP